MDPVTIGVASAGLLGGILGNRASAGQAERNRDFQRRMYRHRYQYTVEDMRRAGLNPALAYQQGGGSAPSGSMASQDDPIKGGIEGGLRGVSTALAVRQNKAQIANIEAQTAKTNAERELLEAETPSRVDWWRQRPGEVAQRVGLMGHQASVASATATFLEDTMQSRVAIAGLERQELQEILTQLRQEIELRGLDRAPLEAQAKFAESWFGKNVAPAIGSASGVAGILTGIVAPFLRYWEEKGRSERGNRTQSSPSRRRLRP